MSLPSPKPTQSEPKAAVAATSAAASVALQQQFQLKEGSVAPNCSTWNNSNRLNNNHTNSFSLHKRSKHEESDEDLFTVPDVEAAASVYGGGAGSHISNNKQSNNNVTEPQFETGFRAKRRRGRNPVDKEYRRLKRLLRNRVSAQQARERKKVYVNDLEAKARELQDKNSKLEERISTLINENTMLRKVLMNTRPKPDENAEPKQDQLSKS